MKVTKRAAFGVGFLGGVLVLLLIRYPTAFGIALNLLLPPSVAVLLWYFNRSHRRRTTTHELFREYYSADFAISRRQASRFMRRYQQVDFHFENPYELGKDDSDLAGYGAILRFWHRVAVLYREEEIDRSLADRILAREMGEWRVRVFDRIERNPEIYVANEVRDLVSHLANGEGQALFEEGVIRARAGQS